MLDRTRAQSQRGKPLSRSRGCRSDPGGQAGGQGAAHSSDTQAGSLSSPQPWFLPARLRAGGARPAVLNCAAGLSIKVTTQLRSTSMHSLSPDGAIHRMPPEPTLPGGLGVGRAGAGMSGRPRQVRKHAGRETPGLMVPEPEQRERTLVIGSWINGLIAVLIPSIVNAGMH